MDEENVIYLGETYDDTALREQVEQVHAELLAVNEGLRLNNQIHAGLVCFLGVLVGVVLMVIFWDRLR